MEEELKYVARVCINSLKKEKDKDYCNNIWVDIVTGKQIGRAHV